jgi:thioredoxin 1
MASNNCLIFTNAGFDDEVLKSDQPVLVDFWADGCKPCEHLAPTIEAVASEYAGKAKVGKLKVVPDSAQIAARYKILAVPTLLLFKSGKVVDQRVGNVHKSEIQKMLDSQV